MQQFPHMSPYIRFCSRQLNAAALIQRRHENVPEFRALLKKCQTNPKVKGMPLTSFLLKPMQRITKYPLMIKKVNSYFKKIKYKVQFYYKRKISKDFGKYGHGTSGSPSAGRSAAQSRGALHSG